jgi:glutathione synthase/RimK-type ligase-like ATP-grasp enzyme
VILIITNKEDIHPTSVIEILQSNKIPVFRLNTEALLTDYEFCWYCNDDKVDFWMKNIQNNLEIQGSDISSVWDRRPQEPSELPIQSTPDIDKHNLKEANGFLRFLRYYIKDIYSIGSIANDRIAASKMLQLKVAKEMGFAVPDTCFSNRKKDILTFAAKHEQIVLKPIDSDFIWDEENDLEYMFYVHKVKSVTIADVPEEAFTQTVSFVQNYVEKAYELRITVVGNEIFACKIDSQIQDEDKGKVDWRQGYDYGLKHECYDLPKEIADKCILFLKQIGLNFGSFDFIYTPTGEYVFLECNPNGQWLWIEEETGLEISKSIAKSLSNNKS